MPERRWSARLPAVPEQPTAVSRSRGWVPVSQEPGHALAALDDEELLGYRLRVLLGPTSRFGARYFALFLCDRDGRLTEKPILSGLHHSGPLPSYNWIEVAQTNAHLSFPNQSAVEIDEPALGRLFEMLLEFLPPGGHLMVEYDSPQRAETARALAQGVPAVATPLGELLFRVGFGARFKDWQIAEGGAEGPRKLQAYKSPSSTEELRWRREAAQEVDGFLRKPASTLQVVRAARARAEALLPLLASDEPSPPPGN